MTVYPTEIHPIRNLDRPSLMRHKVQFPCDAFEILEGVLRGIANAFVITGLKSNNQNYKLELYSGSDGDLLVRHFGAVNDCYKYSKYVWGNALVYDSEQAGNIYYIFENLLNAPIDFDVEIYGVRLR